MYTTWKHLLYSDDLNLRDLHRVQKVHRSRRHVPLFAILGFLLGGFISLSFTWLLVIAAIDMNFLGVGVFIGGFMCILTGTSCLWAAWQFWKERKIDPILGYLKHPENYDFAKADIVEANYQSGNSKGLCRMLVKGQGRTANGKSILFFETFSSRIWKFIDPKSEKNLKKDDDWYDQKGQRPHLPIHVMAIYDIRDPRKSALVGVQKDYLTDFL